MFKLSVNGCPRGRGVDNTLLIKAGNYYTELLMKTDHRELIDKISVNLQIIPNLNKDYNGVGFVGWLDRELNPNQFRIELDDGLCYKDMLVALAHEMAHVRQFAIGAWFQSTDGLTNRWNGMLIDRESTHYYDLPWEIDAHGREYGLYHRFKENQSQVPIFTRSPHIEAVFASLTAKIA